MEVEPENTNADSEEENEMNLLNVNKTRKRHKILDSDSECEDKEVEEELNVKLPSSEKENEEEELNLEDAQKKKMKRFSVIDSDSEEESAVVVHDANAKNVSHSSEEDIEVTPHNKSFPDEETAGEAVICTITNSKGDLIPEDTSTSTKKTYLLYDADTSEDETEKKQEKKTKRTKIPRRVTREEPKKMTAKEAAQQRTEIQSESQRRLRESNVSLPYHKPKSHTIKEFLQKRSKLTSALPMAIKAPPSVAIKMSKDQLEEVSKKLDERIKEVTKFYKSESEEEEENDDVSTEIRGWLSLLVDGAVDKVESKRNEEVIAEVDKETINQETEETVPESSNKRESMDYEFNLDDELNESEAVKRVKVSELLTDQLLNIQPKLSGTPDDVIDLDEGVAKPKAVKKLVEKYFQHTARKVSHKHKVELNIVGVGGKGEIVTETVSMNVDEDEEPAMVETPGAKLQKLREELQLQMAQKRLELWKQKHEQGECLTIEKKDDGDCQKEKDILDDDDEEEFEITDSEEMDEDEDEEDDSLQLEKPKVKSAFINEEADEDEDANDVSDEETVDDVADRDESDGCEGDTEEIQESEEVKSPKKKILRRILPFTEDSDEDGEELTQDNESTKFVKYYSTAEEDLIPPNLPQNRTPQRTQLEKTKSEFEFLTPVTYLTGLQNLNSGSKFLNDSPISPFRTPLYPSPSKEINSPLGPQKKLFPENSDSVETSQETMEDLAQLCSGEFPETQNRESEEKLDETLLPNTQDLLNVCSGDFSVSNEDQSETENREKTVINIQANPEKEIKNLDDDNDQIISQLLDEDELERFKKKFESPINATEPKNQISEDVEEVNATGLINSDDENEGLEIKKKRRQKKLVFSDDDEDGAGSSDGDNESEKEEERIDLHDSDDEEQMLENEIRARGGLNYQTADDFLDKEAELSESEWESADEDEKGLDDLEFEQGDKETFNENEVRSELERIQMRQILDDDNREVKFLQELLLEDGEMHGTGRKRQFRWKTLDSVDNGEFEKRDDDDVYLDEEESEEQWRKMRHKREMFLKKKSTTEDDDSILSDSQILKAGQQILKSKPSGSQCSTPADKPDEDSKEPFSLLSKRGSFLRRSDQVLQRLAEYNKVTTTASTVKNSKCFVFQTIETSEAFVKDNNNKRKAAEGTPNVVKKLRLDDLSPAPGKKQSDKSRRAKKLFGNW